MPKKDEIEPDKRNCNYITMGALFVPSNNKKTIFSQILNARCLNTKNDKWNETYDSCPNNVNCRLDWHNMNNVEIHFTDIRDSRINSSLIKISKSWLKHFSNNNKTIFANVLCIYLNNLEFSFFGDENKEANIYNKFFRTVIEYGLKAYFGKYDKIIIKNIFYDKKSELERHYFFNYRNLEKLSYESSKNIEFTNKIIFVNSDHKAEENYPDESHFIQLIDLIVGAIRHNIFRISDSKKFDLEGMPLIRIRDLDTQNVEICFNGEYLPQYVISKGDHLIGMDGDFKSVIWSSGEALLNQRVMKIIFTKKPILFQRYFFYAIDGPLKVINDLTYSTTVKHLSDDDVRKCLICVPSVEEQQKIVKYLNKATSKIDKTIQVIENKINLLEEYKKSLIHYVVTGKVDVRKSEV